MWSSALALRGLARLGSLGSGRRLLSSSRLTQSAVKGSRPVVEPVSAVDLIRYRAKVVGADSETLRPLREAQATHQPLYARIHIHNWSMLVTKGDTIKLPVNMKDIKIGDVLRFDQCSELGSRNHTLSGERLDPQLFTIKGVVLEKTRVKRSVAERTRRRRRHVRHVVSNNNLTVIRISELALN